MKSMNLGVIFSEGTKRAMRYDVVCIFSLLSFVLYFTYICRMVGAKSAPTITGDIHSDLSGPANQVCMCVTLVMLMG